MFQSQSYQKALLATVKRYNWYYSLMNTISFHCSKLYQFYSHLICNEFTTKYKVIVLFLKTVYGMIHWSIDHALAKFSLSQSNLL